ncbi:DUF742 domain-containing protein [Allonocardiopsis opalescens]|nr:DUF742 domain-containing protein [Allonocardiopsis opalescens]
MTRGDSSWFDEAAGPLVRPYAVTGGRTRSGRTEFDMISLVVAARTETDRRTLDPEHLTILSLCRQPISVAELAAQLDLPMGVVKVLLGDLLDRGDILARAPAPVARLPELNVLQAVLDGISRL